MRASASRLPAEPIDIFQQELLIAEWFRWDAKPPILETQFIEDDFVKDNEVAVLKIPSCIVPQEFNYLINPNHPEAKKMTVISKVPLTFDQRFKQPKKK